MAELTELRMRIGDQTVIFANCDRLEISIHQKVLRGFRESDADGDVTGTIHFRARAVDINKAAVESAATVTAIDDSIPDTNPRE